MNYAIYFNGGYESVLEEIITAQNINDDLTCFLQPYSSKTILKLRNDQPSAESPITAYFSITSDLSKVFFKGTIVGWENKQQLSPERLSYLNNHIKEHQPAEEEIYMRTADGKPCVNLISVSELTKLEVPIPISNFIKITDNTPLKVRSQSGSWSYVGELPSNFIIEQDNDRELTSTEMVEGRKVLRYTTTYERRSGLKKIALAIHGYDCLACGCNFEEMYGEHGKGFIHVHHVKPLSESGETNVDPKTDLIPLCPNCHAMVHKDKKHTLSLDELKDLINLL